MITVEKQSCYLWLCYLALLAACAPANDAYYVSPAGNDLHAGTQAQPFATVERAKQAAIQSLMTGSSHKLTIWLEPGEYHLARPLVFDSDVFSQTGNQLFISSRDGGEAVISGGMVLGNWQKSEDNIWVAELPAELPDLHYVRELFIDGRRAPRARFPNDGYLRVKEAGADKRTNFYFGDGDFPMPDQINNTELVLLHDWSITRIPIQSIEPETGRLTAVDSIGAKVLDFFTLDHWEQQARYFLENDRQFMDEDYEWYFAAETRKIYLRIPASANQEDLQITIPVSEGLFVLQGTAGQPVKNIHINGITFRYSAWGIPEKGYAGIQATYFDPRPKNVDSWSVVPAAVVAVYADSCSFQNCKFEKMGGSGLWLGEGCTNNQVSHSEFTDISANGIMLGEGTQRKAGGDAWWKTVPDQAAKNNMVSNCKISDCGVQYFGAVGIWCGLTAGTAILDNEVYDLPYTGISVGWIWSPEPTPAQKNRLSGNHIHHIMQKLSDGGGVYMLGLQPDSEIRNNLIHDVTLNAGRAESNGMFLDEGTTALVVADNTIYNIAKSPIRFHRATTNLIRNNTLFCREGIAAFAYNNTDTSLISKIGNQIYHPSDEAFDPALKAAIEKWQPAHK